MSMPASCQSLSSAVCVPERSPREMKGDLASLILCSASATFFIPASCAGSLFGPIRTKSLYITGKRFTPCPSFRNFSSCALACTNTTSASQRRAVSSAWPVPNATALTVMPVFSWNFGNRYPNNPESSVEVVEATTMDFSSARPYGATAAAAANVAATINTRRLVTVLPPATWPEEGFIRLIKSASERQFPVWPGQPLDQVGDGAIAAMTGGKRDGYSLWLCCRCVPSCQQVADNEICDADPTRAIASRHGATA